MTKIFLVILNWNGAIDTLECLVSVGRLNLYNIKLSVLVIDNNSIDDSTEKLAHHAINNASYEFIENNKNLGFSGGMNVGIRYALKSGADFVMVINNDTILDKDLLVNLLFSARKRQNVGIICPKVYFAKGYEFHKERYTKNQLGQVIWYAGGIMDWNNIYGINRGVDEVDIGQYTKEEITDFATGNCMFMNTSALKDVGFFNEDYFMYFEDVELSLRMKEKGWQVIYAPGGVIWHKVARSSGIGSDLNDYYTTRNRMLFGLKYSSVRTKIALIRESGRIIIGGRKWQKRGIKDFYLRRFGKGSWK